MDGERIPQAEHAIVEEKKVLEYLLSPAHRTGRSKAKFFASHGWNRQDYVFLLAALVEHAQANPIRSCRTSAFGATYVVEGPIFCPDGRMPLIRTVWQIDTGHIAPRLITAYPVRKYVQRT